jgi:hypothetical protein
MTMCHECCSIASEMLSVDVPPKKIGDPEKRWYFASPNKRVS